MKQHHRPIVFIATVVGVIALAAPAAGSDWFSLQVGSAGFGVSFGSTDWWVYSNAWHDPHWSSSYDTMLAGYGRWIWVDGLGRAWQPYVTVDWRPYTYGRWVYTSLGWTWVSYEPWGYFPHHYGHWAYTHHGWVWIPGYTYRAANVTWVRWGSYVGWYPCPPRGWSHSARGYRDGYSDGYHRGWHDAEHATYVQWSHLGAHDVSRHAVVPSALQRSMGRPSSAAVGSAPTRSELRRHGTAAVAEATLEQRQLRIGERTVTVQRPAGMASTVEQHGRETVQRALGPTARQTSTIRQQSTSRTPPVDRSRSPAAGPAGDSRSRLGSDLGTAREDRSRQSGVVTRSKSPSQQSAGRRPASPAQSRPSRTEPRSSRTASDSRSGNSQTVTRRQPRVAIGAATTPSRVQSQRAEPRSVIANGRSRGGTIAAAPAGRTGTSHTAETTTGRARSQRPASTDRKARSQSRDTDRVSAGAPHGTRKTQRR